MLNDALANTLSIFRTYEKLGKRECLVNPVSKVTKEVLRILQDSRYIGAFEEVTPARGGLFKVNLIGAINKCGVIKPRLAVKLANFEKFEKRSLPAKGVGILIVSTPHGMITHEAAKQKGVGGRLIAYCY